VKVLVSGGLNLSELDGWWSEAYEPEVGWALGDGAEHSEPGWDSMEADQLYRLLEEEVIPEFYDCDLHGVPHAWVTRIRASMARLAPRFSTNLMIREYVEQLYLPAARACRARGERKAALARELVAFGVRIDENWGQVRVGAVDGGWQFEAEVRSGELSPNSLRVELCAEPGGGGEPLRRPMDRGEAIAGSPNGHVSGHGCPRGRPPSSYTARALPFHPEVRLPVEERHILWQRAPARRRVGFRPGRGCAIALLDQSGESRPRRQAFSRCRRSGARRSSPITLSARPPNLTRSAAAIPWSAGHARPITRMKTTDWIRRARVSGRARPTP